VSTVFSALRRTGAVVRPAIRGWRLSALGAVVVLLALGSVALFHPGGMLGGSSSGGGNKSSLTAGNPGAGANGSGNNGQPGGPGGVQPTAGSGGPTGQSLPGAGNGNGGSKSSPTKSPAPIPTPQDSLYGTADVIQSNCGSGYEPGQQCSVYYHGLYSLVSQPTAKLDIEVIVDGVVLNTVTYVAPPGGHRFGGQLKFTVPPHAKKIVYQSFLRNATGGTIVASPPQNTYGYG